MEEALGLNLLNKTKSFAWKICSNISLTKVNLYHWQVIDDDICEACGSSKETSGHLFWECEVAHEVWVQSGISFEAHGVKYNEFVDLVWCLIFFQHVKNDVLEMLFMIAWSMWHNRNVVRHGSSLQSTTLVVQKAQVLLDEF